MQSLSRYNKEIRYLSCAIDLFSKYAWGVPIKGASIVNAFKKIISEGRKPNKIWVDQGSEFYNKSFTDFLKMNNIEMYSTFNEGKSVVAERFIRTLKNKIFKHMAAISKNVYVLDHIVNKYNNTVHKAIKMEPIDVTKMNVKTLMVKMLVGIQVPQKITYVEEGTSQRMGARYKIIYEFKEEVPGNIKETYPVLLVRHVMQQAIVLEKEHGPDVRYSDYKIRCSQYRLEVKFYKYHGLYPIATDHEQDRYEVVGSLIFG